MDVSAGVLMSVITGAIGTVVWLVRMEGRLNTHEAICAERYRRLEERHTEGLDRMRSMDAKLDAMIHAIAARGHE